MTTRLTINPSTGTLKLQSNRQYSNTVIDKLVHWPLMVRLLHLVQRGWAWVGCGLVQSPNGTTKRGLDWYQTANHQRPVHQLHIIRCGTIITFAL